MATVQDSFLAELEATRRRYDERAECRERVRDALREGRLLDVNDFERVRKRLERLNVDLGLASAIEQLPPGATTGRSFGSAVPPERFGANVLGLERVLGRSDLIDVGFLEAGYRAGRCVGRIVVRGADGWVGTGFLVAPNVLLTNNHVLERPEDAARAHVEMDFQAGLDGRPLAPVAFDLDPAALFITEVELDFALVGVAPVSRTGRPLADFGFLKLIEQEGKVILGEKINIIQHPNGEPKQLALRENQLLDLLELFMHYETDTSPGSSGSPVFNDQWEVIGLHHSGVPRTNEAGEILATDGTVWAPVMGEHAIDWMANEGVRISRVLKAIRATELSGAPAALRDAVFEAEPPADAPFEAAAASARGGASGTITVPLQLSISVGDGPVAAVATASAPVAPAGPAPDAPAAPDTPDPELDAALTDLDVGRARPYYDAAADEQARAAYYADVAEPSYAALSALVTQTHARMPRYKPSRLVYPWVDLHRDGQLRSIYSGKTFSPEELIRADLEIERRLERLRRQNAGAALALEAASPFNCEHVVPQSWFAKREPMRGDLHHLFACESGCNSFRGNTPYFDFADFQEKVRHACGLREDDGFEPVAGKGPVARATLYFLLRYPTVVGDEARELQPDRLEVLLSWHEEDAVGEYELHRNAAIAELQGNRNPLIDHPGWARQIDWAPAWGSVT